MRSKEKDYDRDALRAQAQLCVLDPCTDKYKRVTRVDALRLPQVSGIMYEAEVRYFSH